MSGTRRERSDVGRARVPTGGAGALPGVPPRRVLAYGELVVLVALSVAYTLIRAQVHGDAASAIHHGHLIADLEWPVFTHVERPLNHAIVTVPFLAVASCYYYAVLHYVMTPAVLLASRARGGWQYARGYLALVIGSGLGLVCYATFPSAPPRLIPGLDIVDVMARFSHDGWWGGAASAPRGIGEATNQFAAMPSLHFGWSLWCGIQLWGFGKPGWRVVAILYPVVQAIVVVATGNHFLLDVVAGGLCILTGYAVATLIGRWWESLPRVT